MARDDYSDTVLASDYRLLEDLTEAKECAEKARIAGPRPGAASKEQLPRHLRDLVQAAARAGVTLQLMSPGENPLGRQSAPCAVGVVFRVLPPWAACCT